MTCNKAMDAAHAVAVLTEWDEFKEYDWEKVHAKMMKPAYVFDGRGILDFESMKSLGFQCYVIGM